MIGVGMKHSTPLTSLFENEDEVNVVKTAPRKWHQNGSWVGSAPVHVTNCKEELNGPESTNQAATIGSGKVMEAQFKGRRSTILIDMGGGILRLENNLFIPNFKKKIVSLSKLLDQGYKVKEWTKSTFQIFTTTRH